MAKPSISFTAEEEKIIEALNNADYDWRTVDGIETELKDHSLTKDAIKGIIMELGEKGIAIRAVSSKYPDFVYTTREHYEKTQNFGIKL
jgi:hypothetical protein